LRISQQLAGGIISVAVIRHNFRAHRFFHTIFDSFDLIALSVGLIVIAALLEVYVTPVVFVPLVREEKKR
jgi:uncharacterized membrane protein SpoIIM required for sporulation